LKSRESWNKKKEILDQLENELSEDLKIEKESYSKVLNEIQQVQEKHLRGLKRISEIHQKDLELSNSNYQKSLKEIEEQANLNLKIEINKLLEKLKKEKLECLENFPVKLKNSIMQWPYSMIYQQNTSIENESEKLSKQFEQVLTRIGINKKDFFNMMDRNLDIDLKTDTNASFN
jgi:hypothetical protein